MISERDEKIARKNLLRESEEAEGGKIEGYDFNKGVDYKEIIKSFKSVGFQATEFSKAIEIVNHMIENKAFIFLGYTSNMVSCGNREIIRWLVEKGKVNVLVSTAGGIEEDFIKCLGNFVSGDFRASGKVLREKGINRTGNIFVPNNRYIDFEEWVQPILEELYQEQKKSNGILTSMDLIWKLGEKINDKRSIYYWAWKNKIRVYCPALMDGALGDNIYFFKFKHPDFKIDMTDDIVEFNNITIGLRKSGVLVIGSGVVKCTILNANMLRDGADYAVYINTSAEYDGSDSGALPEEAVSWGKIRKDAERVKVFGDATILFPILVAESFASQNS